MEYEKELKERLEKDVWLRHLFNKIRKEVKITLHTGQKIMGILRSIQFSRGYINLEVEGKKIHFINWKHVEEMAVKKGDKK